MLKQSLQCTVNEVSVRWQLSENDIHTSSLKLRLGKPRCSKLFHGAGAHGAVSPCAIVFCWHQLRIDLSPMLEHSAGRRVSDIRTQSEPRGGVLMKRPIPVLLGAKKGFDIADTPTMKF